MRIRIDKYIYDENNTKKKKLFVYENGGIKGIEKNIKDSSLRTMGKLNSYLANTNKQAQECFESLIEYETDIGSKEVKMA